MDFREKILEDLKEVVLTLGSGNLSNDRIKGLWLQKSNHVMEAINLLSKEDFNWVESHYRKWCEGLGIEINDQDKNIINLLLNYYS
jgi:hypothetical protein